jgi:2-oxoglutarate ferredoxin oxidoreductase subunit alpha
MADAALAHLRESCRIPEEVEIVERKKASGVPHFGSGEMAGVPPMASFGEGEGLLITGSTHDEYGYRRTQDSNVQRRLVERLNQKILSNAEKIVQTEGYFLEREIASSASGGLAMTVHSNADVVVVAYGMVARAALAAVKAARQNGINVGLLRLKTIWPFPEGTIRSLKARRIIVPELNRGQLVREVERFATGEVIHVNRVDGEVMRPGEILEAIEGARG